MHRPIIGRCAPLPRPTARRLSDLHPYARLDLPAPASLDRIIGRVCAAGVVVILALLAAGVLA